LYFKRLERGHFRWPAKGDTATIVLETKELSYLIEGAKLEKKLKTRGSIRAANLLKYLYRKSAWIRIKSSFLAFFMV